MGMCHLTEKVWFLSSLVLNRVYNFTQVGLDNKQGIACTADLVCSRADQRNCLGHDDITCGVKHLLSFVTPALGFIQEVGRMLHET